MNDYKFKSPLHQMAATTATDFWNDSCSIEELTYAIENGAVGATSNPTIVLEVLKKEMPLWKERLQQMIAENPQLLGRRTGLDAFSRRSAVKGAEPARAGLRAREPSEGTPLHPDQPGQLPQRRGAGQPGGAFQPAGAQHAGQAAGHTAPGCRPSKKPPFTG